MHAALINWNIKKVYLNSDEIVNEKLKKNSLSIAWINSKNNAFLPMSMFLLLKFFHHLTF